MNKNILLLFTILLAVCQPQYIYLQDNGCASLNINSKCLACKKYSLLSICMPVNQICQDYNFVDGFCLTCVPGFTQGYCHPSKMTEVHPNQANCAFFNRAIQFCLICNTGYRVLNGACLPLIPDCDIYSLKRKCIGCKNGYLLKNQALCVKNSPIHAKQDINAISTLYKPRFQLDAQKNQQEQSKSSFINDKKLVMSYDPLCSIFQKGACIKCSYGAFFDTQGVCKLSKPLCKQSNLNGACLACYSDFQLKDGLCILNSIQNLEKFTDCYIGYALFQGECIENSKFKDLNGYDIKCKQYDDTGNCIDCSERYFIENGTCVQVSLYCKTFNPMFGYCLSCYDGYHIGKLGQCIINN